ncbi:winged helix-turn-helix transcriptional regulator [Longispora albida]|uniref:winged helix-turn-helix transcriptional regulator n=1 Tax=Longispora albida TaxID=203523 RepID=UPI0003711CF4|nr:helix-turn-helix domain-containing protein [Longispora albida]
MEAIPKTSEGYCAQVQFAAELVGRRWTASIIGVLCELGHARFRDIKASIPGLSDRLLADRLEELEQYGITRRCPDGSGYGITEKGRELEPILGSLGTWTYKWDDELGPKPGRKNCPSAEACPEPDEDGTEAGPVNTTVTAAPSGPAQVRVDA